MAAEYTKGGVVGMFPHETLRWAPCPWLLDLIEPDFIHIVADGKVVQSGDKSLSGTQAPMPTTSGRFWSSQPDFQVSAEPLSPSQPPPRPPLAQMEVNRLTFQRVAWTGGAILIP